MELDEILLRKQHLQQLESRENYPESPQKAYLTMERDEMIRYIEFLQERIDEEKRSREVSDKRFEEEAARTVARKGCFSMLHVKIGCLQPLYRQVPSSACPKRHITTFGRLLEMLRQR